MQRTVVFAECVGLETAKARPEELRSFLVLADDP